MNPTLFGGASCLVSLLPVLRGSSFFFVAVAVRECQALSIVLARVPLANLMLCAIIAHAGQWGLRFQALGIAPVHAAAGQTSASARLLLPLAMWLDSPGLPGAAVSCVLLGLALFSTASGYLLYLRVLDLAGAVNLLLVTLLIPVTRFQLGWAILGEALAANDLIGLAGIAAGLVIIDGRLWRGAASSGQA